MAQTPDEVQAAFREWANKSLHEVSNAGVDASTVDLRPLKKMIGDAKIVALSEATHGGAEPLMFRNHVLKYLVEQLGFDAIAIESGVVESRVVHDYVVDGKGELDNVAKQGLTWTFDTFPQNKAMIRWMRQHNSKLPSGKRKVEFYGYDVPGSPGNISATRGPETALESAIEYLRVVDQQAAAQLRSRVDVFLPSRKRGENYVRSYESYAGLRERERDSLTAAIADLNSRLEDHRFQYIEKSSNDDYEWGMRAAIGARQIDLWLRHIPVGWKVADGFEWQRDATQYRERAMAENFDWIVRRLGPHGKVLVFGAVLHVASAPFRLPDAPERDMLPFGAYVKAHFGSAFINVLSEVNGGEIEDCSQRERKPMPLKPPPEWTASALFASVKAPRYILDVRSAPPRLSAWLHQTRDHWNGFGSMKFSTADAFDIVSYASPITSACASETSGK